MCTLWQSAVEWVGGAVMFGMFDQQEGEKMKIKSIKNTSTCCPSQWEGITENNETFYIRYRWGRLTIQLSEPDGTLSNAINSGRMLYQKQIGEEFAGVIHIEEVLEIMKKALILSDV